MHRFLYFKVLILEQNRFQIAPEPLYLNNGFSVILLNREKKYDLFRTMVLYCEPFQRRQFFLRFIIINPWVVEFLQHSVLRLIKLNVVLYHCAIIVSVIILLYTLWIIRRYPYSRIIYFTIYNIYYTSCMLCVGIK